MRVSFGYDAVVWGQHLCSPPGARWWCSAHGIFAVRQMSSAEGVGTSPRPVCDQRSAAERKWSSGTCAARFEFVAGCPARFYVRRVGGNRIVGMCLAAILRAWWRAVNVPTVNAQGVSMDMVDSDCSGL